VKSIVFAVCCLALLASAGFAAQTPQPPAAQAAGTQTAAQAPAPSQAQLPSLVPELTRVIGNLNPLANAVATTCNITCLDARQQCIAQCGGRLVCVNYFDCPTSDPCSYTCVCTGTCPPTP